MVDPGRPDVRTICCRCFTRGARKGNGGQENEITLLRGHPLQGHALSPVSGITRLQQCSGNDSQVNACLACCNGVFSHQNQRKQMKMGFTRELRDDGRLATLG